MRPKWNDIQVCCSTNIHGRNASWGHQNPIFPDFLAFQLLVLNMIFCHFSPLFPAHECCHHATMPLKVIVIITKCWDPNIFQETATRGHFQLIFSAFHMYILNWAFWSFFAPFCMLISDPLTPLHFRLSSMSCLGAVEMTSMKKTPQKSATSSFTPF